MGNPHIVISYNGCWYVWNTRRPLIKALLEKGCQVTIVAPRDEYTDKLTAMGLGYREISMDPKGLNPLADLKTLKEFRQIYRELSPDAVLQYTIKPNIYGSIAAGKLNIPAVNNITGLGSVFDKSGPLQTMVRVLYRFAFSRVYRVFFQNDDDKELFLSSRLVSKKQTDLLPGSGVNPEYFSPRPRPEGPFRFLYVGRLLKAKGVEDFISAAEILKPEYPDTEFVLVGPYDATDPYMVDKSVLDKAIEKGTVEWKGATDEIRDPLAEAGCVVLPSKYREGIPRSLLEAAAMGKPLIAADSIGTREPVQNGVNGYLCSPGNPTDIASKMRAVLELSPEKLEHMGHASREIAVSRFDEAIVINKYLKVVDEIIRQG